MSPGDGGGRVGEHGVKLIEHGDLIGESFVNGPTRSGVGGAGEGESVGEEKRASVGIAYVGSGIGAARRDVAVAIEKQSPIPIVGNLNEVGRAVVERAHFCGDIGLRARSLRDGKNENRSDGDEKHGGFNLLPHFNSSCCCEVRGSGEIIRRRNFGDDAGGGFRGDRRRFSAAQSEIQSAAELNLPFRQGRSEAERRAGGERGAAVHVEGSEPWLEPEERTHFVVHAGVVSAIGDVEAFCSQQQSRVFANSVLPGQARVEVNIVGAEASVARIADGTLVGDVIIAIDRAACEQIERMTAVVLENRRKLKTGQESVLPRAVDHPGQNHFVAFIEFRERALRVQVRGILRTEVGVEIGAGVEGFAVGVISEEREIVVEAFVDFDNAAFVEARRGGSVLVILNDQRIYKASERVWRARQTFSAAERIGCRGGVPVSIGNGLAVRQSDGAHRGGGQQVGVDRDRDVDGVGINEADGNREARSDFAFDSQRSLLRVKRPVVGRIAEQYSQGRELTLVLHENAEVRDVSRRDASVRSGRRGGAGDLVCAGRIPWRRRRGKKTRKYGPCGLDERKNTETGIYINGNKPVARAAAIPRKPEGYGRIGDPDAASGDDVVDLVGNLRSIVLILDGAAILIQDSQAQIHLGNLGVNGPVEDPVPAADYGFVILEGIPCEGDAWGDVAIVSVEREILRINFITEAVVQGEIGSNLPGVLQIESRKWPGVGGVVRVAEALLIYLRC